MSYLYVPSSLSGLGDSCIVNASGARVCTAAPATAGPTTGGRRRGGGGGGNWQPWMAPNSPWSQGQTNAPKRRQRHSGGPRACPTCGPSPATNYPGLNYAPGTNVYGDATGSIGGGSGIGTRFGAKLEGLGLQVFGGPARRVPSVFQNRLPIPPTTIIPVVATPTQPQTWWNRSGGGQNGRQYKSNNRQGQSYGTSNYAPWNTSPTCSDPTSGYYNPQDPSCTTGNQSLTEICTDPTNPSYNPSNPSCASILAASAATTDAATTTTATTTDTTDWGMYALLGGGVLLLVMLFKK